MSAAAILSGRRPFAAVLVCALALVAGGVVMTELFRLAACPLCIIQRMAYLGLAAVASLGLLAGGQSPLVRRLIALAMAAVAGVGAFVAGYQTWIQRFAPDTGCSAYQSWWEEMVERAGDLVPLLFQSDGICSDPGFVFLGLSIAEWSLVCFVGFLALGLIIAVRGR
jgi:disulfide bond formation protein DsbB